MYYFCNDYGAGAHPAVLEAVNSINNSTFPGYGEDEICAEAATLIKKACACPGADVHFLIGGTGANFTAICAFLRPWEAVISPVTGHINGHEVGAVEATGHKIIPIPAGSDGKLSPRLLPPVLLEYSHLHMVKPRLVYISQATESGMVYTRAELEALSAFCKANDLLLFLDGARLGAALSSPACDVTLPDLARLTDAFYIGGTKNGAFMGEALVIVNPALQPDFFRVQKQRGGVLAKGFLLGAQFKALFTNDLYLSIGRHADELAARLQDGLKALGWPLMVDSPTNQIFPVVPNSLLPRLEELCFFNTWCPMDEDHTVIRFVTFFATKQEDVDGLLSALSKKPFRLL